MNEKERCAFNGKKIVPSTFYLALSAFFFASLYTQNFIFIDVDSETQPIFCIFFACMIFIFHRHDFIVNKIQLLTLLLITLIVASFIFHLVFSEVEINYLSYASYLIGPFIFLVSRKSVTVNKYSLLFSEFYVVLTFLFAVGYVFQIHSVMDFFSLVSTSLLRRQYGSATEDVRGMAFLFGEPSYAAIGLGVMIVFFRLAISRGLINDRRANFFILMLFFCILTTKSIMGLLILLFLFFRVSSLKVLGFYVVAFLGLGLAFLPILSLYIPRIGEISNAISSIDFNMDIYDLAIVISYAEPSGTSRIIANLIGFLGMLKAPLFGFGAGQIQEHWLEVVDQFGMDFIYNHWGFAESAKFGTGIKAQTYVFNAAFDFGVLFFIVFCALIVSSISRYYKSSISNMKTGVIPLLLLLAFFQGQIANVYMWYLMLLIMCEFREVKVENVVN